MATERDRISESAEPQGASGASPDVLCRVVGEEALLLDTRTGDYFALDRIGTEIWTQLSAGASVEEITTEVSERYGADVSTVRGDVLDLIEELRDARLWSP